MSFRTERNPGEVKVYFERPVSGKMSLADLGLTNEQLAFEGGNVRLVFDFEQVGEHDYFKVPTIEVGYTEEMSETHWQCDFNATTIVDKLDHHGKSTVILLNRNKLNTLEQHHQNQLVLHAEFPKPVQLTAASTCINFFR